MDEKMKVRIEELKTVDDFISILEDTMDLEFEENYQIVKSAVMKLKEKGMLHKMMDNPENLKIWIDWNKKFGNEIYNLKR